MTNLFPAGATEYSAHVSAESFGGPGALGLMPGFPDRSGSVGKARWYVRWVKAEFDGIPIGDVLPLAEDLRERGVYCYLDRGTTGGGVHLTIFTDAPVPQPKAHEALREISKVATSLGLPAPCKSVPSNPYNAGTGIFLPFRGAERDGYGYNPLLDPYTGEAIRLSDAQGKIRRTFSANLLSLSPSGISVDSEKAKPYRRPRKKVVADPESSWKTELDRLGSVWEEGVRQDLTMGAAAYGLLLGIEAERVEEDLERLVEEAEDEEIGQRLKAIANTVSKHGQGKPVAWRSYYEAAGLEPPSLGLVPTDEVLEKIRAVEAHARLITWKGTKEITASRVYFGLLRVARRHGTDAPGGVEVSISLRDLALEVGLGVKALMSAVNTTLKEKDLVRRSKDSKGPYSGALLIVTEGLDLSQTTASLPVGDDEEGWCPSDPNLRVRWGPGRLGKLSEGVIEALWHLGRAKRGEVARWISPDRKGDSINKHLKKLRESGLVDLDEEGCYSLTPDYKSFLQVQLVADRSKHAQVKDRTRYALQTSAFNSRLLGEDPKQQDHEQFKSA